MRSIKVNLLVVLALVLLSDAAWSRQTAMVQARDLDFVPATAPILINS